MQTDVQIPDDPSIVKPIFEEMRQNLHLNIAQTFDQREKALNQLIQGYEAMLPEIDQALKADLGYNSFMSNFAAHAVSLNEIKDLAKNFRKWAQVRPVPTPMALGLASCEVEYEPLGIALVLSAWNYPIYTALPPLAAAIAAGNCVILKPSQLAPYTSRVIKQLFDKHMDPRFYRVIEGRVEVGRALTQLKVDIICFTGSTQTGRLVAIEAAKNITPCLLELGGKCPVIIDQSADLDSASKRIIFGKWLNCGQTCVGTDHVYVHEKIYEHFKKVFIRQVKAAFDKQDLIANGDYAKIINKNHMKRLQSYLTEEHKGKVIYGGKVVEEKLHMSPTVIEQPSHDSAMMSNQIFGPILPIFPYSDIKDLTKQLRDKPKPLAVYLFTSNKKVEDHVKTNTSSGAFVVNDALVQVLNCHLPFGGVGESGYGRYHGQSGFISFSNPKSIARTKAIDAYPLSNRFFPYTEHKKRAMTFLLKVGGTTYTQLKNGSAIVAIAVAAALGYLKMRPYL